MRILDFADGFESPNAPALGDISSNQMRTYANDAAFLAAKSENVGVAEKGDFYVVTSTNTIRFCYDGTNFVNVVDEVHNATLAGIITFSASDVHSDTIKAKEGTTKGLDVNAAGVLALGHTTATQVNIGQTGVTTYIKGNLDVAGTTTTINSTVLDVTDVNITINKGGNDASSEGAGLSVDRTGTVGSIKYESALASKWKAGALGAELEVVTVSSTQTLTGKTIDSDQNTLSNIKNSDIKALAAIARTKLADGTASHVLINDPSGVMSSEATLAKVRGGSGQDNSSLTFPASGTLATLAGSEVLTNKTFDADLNTLSNVKNADIKTGADIARAKLASGTADHVVINSGAGAFSSEATLAKVRGGTGADNSSVTFPSTGVIVTEAASETLTNKTISATTNTLSDITNTSIDAAAAIARTKLASGTANHVLINNGSGVMSSEASLDETRGGTAQTSYTTGDILYSSATDTLSKLGVGTNGQVLTVTAGVPAWGAAGGAGCVPPGTGHSRRPGDRAGRCRV